MDIVKIDKKYLFKLIEHNVEYEIIKNNTLSEQYKLFNEDWNGYEFIDSLRVPFKNKYGSSKIQEHKSFVPVYTQESYNKWIKDHDKELIQAGYCENYAGQCFYLI